MKALGSSLLLLNVVLVLPLSAQITISAAELHFELGSTRTYLTHSSDPVFVEGVIGAPGGPQQWDFSASAFADLYTYEIGRADESTVGGPFPDAELAEKLTIDSTGSMSWTLFGLSEAGRTLHGFHDPVTNPPSPVVKFTTPIIDYPTPMSFGDEWGAVASFDIEQLIGGSLLPTALDSKITAKVDAFGTLVLPTLGTVEVIRINELNTTDSVIDIGGIPLALPTAYVRTYTWLSREYGIVAQMTSEAGTELVPDLFEFAARFIRLSDRIGPPEPGEEFRILTVARESADSVTIAWTSRVGQTYTVETSDDLRKWEVLSTDEESPYTDSGIPADVTRRYYRVRSEE